MALFNMGGFGLDIGLGALRMGPKGRGNSDGFDRARGDLLPLYDEAQKLYEPYMGLAGGLGQLQSDINAGRYSTQFSNAPGLERFNFNFEEDPGYQFALEQGQRGVQSGLAASGMRGGGAAMKGIERFRQGLAGQQIGDAFNRQLQGYQAAQGNRLGLAQLGANVEQMRANQAQNMMNTQFGIGSQGLGLLGNMANLKTGLAGNLVDLQVGKYQADEARRIANQNSQNQVVGNLITGAAMTAPYWLPMLSDIRLKENIKLKRNEKGFNIYEFSYKDDPRRFEGVIAQEVQAIQPEAIEEIDGYLAVNYPMIGIEMKEVG
jgi:hypothetical protein